MIDVRKLPLGEGWVLVPRERAARPHDFQATDAVRLPTRCPFCAGHEVDTPKPLAVYADPASRLWRVRVIPNKYPAVSPLAADPVQSSAIRSSAIQSSLAQLPRSPASSRVKRITNHDPCAPHLPRARGEGCHEVVVESSRHVTRFSDLTATELKFTLQAYRDRLRAHRDDPRLAYSLVFRNSGVGGGASLEHAHSQIIATPWVPSAIETELRLSHAWHEKTGTCLLCHLVARECEARQRIVARSRSFVAWCPYASRFAFETWIAPASHRVAFEDTSDRQLAELGRLLRDMVSCIERVPGSRGYNFWIHTSPHALRSSPYSHWHLEIVPRTAQQAGFEWGGGDYINSVPPEEAARDLVALRSAESVARDSRS